MTHTLPAITGQILGPDRAAITGQIDYEPSVTYLGTLRGYGLTARFPLNELSGTTLTESENGWNGTYSNVALDQVDAPLGISGRAGAWANASSSYGNIYTAALSAAFSGDVGSIIIWTKGGAGWLSNLAAEYLYRLEYNTNNFLFAASLPTGARDFRFRYEANNVRADVDFTLPLEPTDFVMYTFVYADAANGGACAVYINDDLVGTATQTANWTGLGLGSTTTIIGAADSSGNNAIDANLYEMALSPAALTAEQVAALYALGYPGGPPASFDKVFLVAGQSNAQGRITNNQSYTGSENAYVFDENDTAWRTLADPTDSDVAFGSVWPIVASRISDNHGEVVGFITTADGGTGLVTPNADWTKGGANYNNALSRLTASNTYKLDAILWYQGERDVVNGIATATYQAALSQMLDDIQADTGYSSVKLIAALVGEYSTEADASINNIRNAIINRWENDADILPGPTAHDQSFADGLHWATDAEALTLANRWYRAIAYHIYGGSESPRGPQFSSAVRSGTTVTVTFTGGEGALQNATDTTGWRFTDNGTPITISAAAANGTNAVDLTLASTPSGTELISFSQGNDIGTSLSDSGTYPLPPEPFVDQAVS